VLDAGGTPVMAWVVDRDGEKRSAAYELFSRFEIGQRIALPLLYADDEGRSTRIVALNTDTVGDPREVTLRLWDLLGTEVECAACEIVLEPGGSVSWDLSDIDDISSRFAGSGEIVSDGGLLAIVIDARSRSTPSSRRTPDTRGCRSAARRWRTSCGTATSSTIRAHRSGSIAIGSCCRPGTAPRSCTRCSTCSATTCRSTS
jgi:hypothetical protein